MATYPDCPQCASSYTYEDQTLYVCPECAHEWLIDAEEEQEEIVEEKVYRDTHGNILVDGDSVTVIQDLKVKGSSLVVKKGTTVKNIRLIDEDHDIDCRIDGIGAMQLKTQFVKKI